MKLSGNFTQDDVVIGDYRVSLDKQRHEHRQQTFTFIKWFCGVCYLLFLCFLIELHVYDNMRSILVENQHLLIIGMALFFVPSFILWTVIRAVYKADSDKDTPSPLEIVSKVNEL